MPPYSPSWVNRLLERIEQSRIPSWLIYVGILLLSLLYVVVSVLAESSRYLTEILPLVALNAIWIALPLAGFQYLIRYANQALTAFRPAMSCSSERVEALRYRLTTIPMNVSVLTPIFVGFLVYGDAIWGSSSIVGDLNSPITIALAPLFPTVSLSLIILFIYLTLRQLALVDFMYSLVDKLNVFNLEPLFILSGLTARTAIIWILFLSANILIGGVARTISLQAFILLATAQILLALAAFLIPLWRIHRRITEEKERMLEENSNLLERAYRDLQQLLEKTDYDAMSRFSRGVDSLLTFRAELNKIPTWPWRPETLRGFLSAVSLPIVIWIIQRLLASFL